MCRAFFKRHIVPKTAPPLLHHPALVHGLLPNHFAEQTFSSRYPTGDFEGFDGIGIKSLLLRQEKFIALTQTQKRRFVL